MKKKLGVLVAFLCLSFSVNAEECSSVIALSKTAKTFIKTKESLSDLSSSFCSAYKSYKTSNRVTDVEASYNLFSAAVSSGASSVESLGQTYCSQSDDYRVNKVAINSFEESIDPQAYQAYKSCIDRTDRSLAFGVITIADNQFGLIVNFNVIGSSPATIIAKPSLNANCSWGNAGRFHRGKNHLCSVGC